MLRRWGSQSGSILRSRNHNSTPNRICAVKDITKRQYSESNPPTHSPWQWATASSSAVTTREAVRQCCNLLKESHPSLTGASSDALVFVWASQYRVEAARIIPRLIASEGLCPEQNIFGSNTSQGLVGVESEYLKCGLTISMAALPHVNIHPFYSTTPSVPSFSDTAANLLDMTQFQELNASPSVQNNAALMVMINRAQGFDDELFLSRLNVAFPHVPKFGPIFGKKSGDPDLLFVNGEPFTEGAGGFLVQGPFKFNHIHADGFTPLGSPFTITNGSGKNVNSLNNAPSAEALTARLRSFGLAPVNYTLLLARVFPRSDQPIARNPVRVLPWSEDRSVLRFAESVRTGDMVQFYFYDFKPLVADIAVHTEQYLKQIQQPGGKSMNSDVGVLAFSSLLDPNTLDELYAPPPEDSQRGYDMSFYPLSEKSPNPPVIRPKPSAKAAANQAAPRDETDNETGDEANAIFDQSFDDVDYFDNPDDLKVEIERNFTTVGARDTLAGPITPAILVSGEDNRANSSISSIDIVIFSHPDVDPSLQTENSTQSTLDSDTLSPQQ